MTHGDGKYGQIWFQNWLNAESEPLVFKVKACSDARILLSEYVGVTEGSVYEVRTTFGPLCLAAIV